MTTAALSPHRYASGNLRTSSLCQGINETNGQPCRKNVSSSRVFQYCRQHEDQAQRSRPNPPYPVDISHDNVNDPIKHTGRYVTEAHSRQQRPQAEGFSPPMKIPGAFPDARTMRMVTDREAIVPRVVANDSTDSASQRLTAADNSLKHTQTTILTTRPLVQHEIVSGQTAGRSFRDSRSQSSQEKQSLEEKAGSATNLPIKHDKKNRFSMTKLLVSLGCVPPTMLHSKVRGLPPQRTIGESQKESPALFVAKDEKSDIKRVRRKPVDMRTKQQIELENKIRSDRAEIQRLISTDSIPQTNEKLAGANLSSTTALAETTERLIAPGRGPDMVGRVRSDLQPRLSPDLIRQRMTKMQQDAYFLDRYANMLDYPHKSTKGMARMQEVIRSIVNAALMASFSESDLLGWEFVYVFRLDGDYHNTPKISLKIGRSKDVDARLKQWFAQCRYRIDKLEQFETQHAVLLERMLHLEFEEDRELKQCRCGRTHREWFDIRRDDARGRIKRALAKWAAFADEVQALRSTNAKSHR